MDLSRSYISPIQEANENEREKMAFYNPFQAQILDSGALPDQQEVASVVILSAN